MKKKVLSVIIASMFLLSVSACSGSGLGGAGGQNSEPVQIPTGIWVIRYYGDENAQYLEEYNMTEDYYGLPINTIEKFILDFDRTAYFTLDDSGSGTFTDIWGETQEASFDSSTITFEDGYTVEYTRKGDFLWYRDQYQDYYNVMESVSEELLRKIENGAFGCVEPGKAEVGDCVAFGTYDTWPYNEKTETLKWRVIDKDGDCLMIICDPLIDAFSYNYNPDMTGLDSITWENCTLRAFLNDPEGFLSCFTDDELAMIQTTHLDNNAANEELMKTLKVYSATKFGKTRAEVEREIQSRWSAAEKAKGGEIGALDDLGGISSAKEPPRSRVTDSAPSAASSEPRKGFLDDWMAKKKATAPTPAQNPAPDHTPPAPTTTAKPLEQPAPEEKPNEAIFRIR